MPLKRLLLVLSFVALGAFAVVEFVKVNSLRHELESLKETPEVPVVPPAPVVEATRIICPLCNGEKFIKIPVVPDNPIYNRRQTCPVCRGAGGRMLTVPPEQTI